MKAASVLAAVLISLTMTGCMFKDQPTRDEAAASRPAPESPAEETRVLVAQLLDAHNEAVGQIRVSSALRAQSQADCN